MPPSPLVKLSIDEGATFGAPGVKAIIGAGDVLVAELDSVVGVASVSWTVASTDETELPASYPLTISGARGERCSLTVGGTGTSGILQCTINSGRVNAGAGLDTVDYTQTRSRIKWAVLTTEGAEAVCKDEGMESDPVWGWLPQLNSAIRNPGGTVAPSRTITAGAGLTGGGSLALDRTIDVGAHADGSIVVNADNIQVGVLGFARVAAGLAAATGDVSVNDQQIVDVADGVADHDAVNVGQLNAAVGGVSAATTGAEIVPTDVTHPGGVGTPLQFEAAGHGLTTGDWVYVPYTLALGDPDEIAVTTYTWLYQVTVLDVDHFELIGSSYHGGLMVAGAPIYRCAVLLDLPADLAEFTMASTKVMAWATSGGGASGAYMRSDDRKIARNVVFDRADAIGWTLDTLGLDQLAVGSVVNDGGEIGLTLVGSHHGFDGASVTISGVGDGADGTWPVVDTGPSAVQLTGSTYTTSTYPGSGGVCRLNWRYATAQKIIGDRFVVIAVGGTAAISWAARATGLL